MKLPMDTLVLLLGGCLLLMCGTARAWHSEELEIFDLVEEINKNFYEFMGINQTATNNEIKRAFRTLSIVLHPDKNPSEDANIQFRNLVSIYEVLKDSSKREKYDKVLKEGMPNWKSALYYYRRMRKIGLYEGAFILFLIITVGQYLFAWAAYLEKKYTAEQVFGTKLKKLQKKNKNIDMDVILSEIPMPSLLNTLPIQIPVAIWNLPKTIKNGFSKANELKELALEKRRQELEAARRQEELEREAEEQARLRKEQKENLRKRKQNTKAPEKTEEELRGYSRINARQLNEEDGMRPAAQKSTVSGGFWTDEDLTELIRLVKKHPGGAGSRWNTIAESMNRSVQEVTFMAAKMKENGYRIPGQTESVAENLVQESQEAVRKEKVKKSASVTATAAPGTVTSSSEKSMLIPETNWTQEQQRALEAAIVKNRKAASGDRWQKIANSVPEKTKEECLVRYKYLCELVKTQKQAEEAEAVANAELDNPPNEEGLPEELLAEEVEAPAAATAVSKKLSKRELRRQKQNYSTSDDSDADAYQYEIS
ncbi:dnaJ homolog subfamily C member 1 [Drosophila pseudoobscura]|uniref:DnaJ homolog subfamily C member 1 n=1 Tax=Drosophila pseudoobscura pseudoobscura TaxID=46245 RepID=A0A6I8UG91_DROPS|nr:dnaJ homolog subfamily C member 1 [Drosophila pseudoobscura]